VALWILVLSASAVFALGGVTGEGLFDRLHTGEPRVEGSESERGKDLIAQNEDVGELLIAALTEISEETLTDSAKHMAGFHSRVMDLPGVAWVVHPFVFPETLEDPQAGPLVAEDGFIIQVGLEKSLAPEAELQAHNAVLEEFNSLGETLQASTITSSELLMVEEVTDQIQTDLKRGEAIALPISI